MTQYKPLINVGYNDKDYYARKRKSSYAGKVSQGKQRCRKLFNTLRETEITLARAWEALINRNTKIIKISMDQW